MTDSKPQIVMRSGPIPGASYYLDKPEVSIGRDLANDIPVPDSEISRRHARFIVKDDGVYIEDLGSTNGTFLNGVRLSAPKRLANGDLVTLAESTVMSFEWEQAAQVVDKLPTYSAYAEQPEPVYTEPQPVYQPIPQPVPQRPLAPEPTPEVRRRRPWFLNFLLVLLIILIIIGLVLVFMPESWWCFLSFNRLPGCY